MLKNVAKRLLRPFTRTIADCPLRARFGLVLRGVRIPHKACGAALMTYLPEPFIESPDSSEFRSHANRWRSVAIADLLAAEGFSVDVTSWRNPSPPSGRHYDLIVGLGPAFTAAAAKRSPGTKALYLATGAHPDQTNAALVQRQDEFQRRHGTRVRISLLDPDCGASLADMIAIVGNQWVANTYGGATRAPMVSCPNSVTDGVQNTLARKDFSLARRHFLWMAAYGALRRRLDVVLEVFAARPELTLWICGAVQHEKQFFAAMEDWLCSTENVHFVGWVDVGENTYHDLTRKCGFFIYPSASDGMPGSVVNAMASGLVPLVTREAGIDVNGFGSMISATTVTAIGTMVDTAASTSAAELEIRSALAVQATQSKYSKARFVTQFELALGQLLNSRHLLPSGRRK